MSKAIPAPKPREAISISSTLDALIQMSEGNPGAASVIGQLMQDPCEGFMAVLHMDDMNIRGCQIWVGYKDHCGSDIDRFKAAILDRDAAMVETINRIALPQTGHKAVEHGASFQR